MKFTYFTIFLYEKMPYKYFNAEFLSAKCFFKKLAYGFYYSLFEVASCQVSG